MAFCNRVEQEAKHCTFKCATAGCTADKIAIRDQIIIGIVSEKIREEALKESWDLAALRTNGMKLDSATRGATEISGDTASINKLGKYSYKNLKNQKQGATETAQKPVKCWFCTMEVVGLRKHLMKCPGKSATCTSCGKPGHLTIACNSGKKPALVVEVKEEEQVVNAVTVVETKNTPDEVVYNVNIFRITSTLSDGDDFKVSVVLNGIVVITLADRS